MLPAPTKRLRFREMSSDDLDLMADMLGDAEVMRFYPRPKTREEASAWITWNQRGYTECGHGLWIIETHDGEFVGDCGLTWQEVNGERMLEVGYHVIPAFQRRGLAREAARACLTAATDVLGASHVIAIIVPDNVPSHRVAGSLGMAVERETRTRDGQPIVVYGITARRAEIRADGDRVVEHLKAHPPARRELDELGTPRDDLS